MDNHMSLGSLPGHIPTTRPSSAVKAVKSEDVPLNIPQSQHPWFPPLTIEVPQSIDTTAPATVVNHPKPGPSTAYHLLSPFSTQSPRFDGMSGASSQTSSSTSGNYPRTNFPSAFLQSPAGSTAFIHHSFQQHDSMNPNQSAPYQAPDFGPQRMSISAEFSPRYPQIHSGYGSSLISPRSYIISSDTTPIQQFNMPHFSQRNQSQLKPAFSPNYPLDYQPFPIDQSDQPELQSKLHHEAYHGSHQTSVHSPQIFKSQPVSPTYSKTRHSQSPQNDRRLNVHASPFEFKSSSEHQKLSHMSNIPALTSKANEIVEQSTSPAFLDQRSPQTFVLGPDQDNPKYSTSSQPSHSPKHVQAFSQNIHGRDLQFSGVSNQVGRSHPQNVNDSHEVVLLEGSEPSRRTEYFHSNHSASTALPLTIQPLSLPQTLTTSLPSSLPSSLPTSLDSSLISSSPGTIRFTSQFDSPINSQQNTPFSSSSEHRQAFSHLQLASPPQISHHNPQIVLTMPPTSPRSSLSLNSQSQNNKMVLPPQLSVPSTSAHAQTTSTSRKQPSITFSNFPIHALPANQKETTRTTVPSIHFANGSILDNPQLPSPQPSTQSPSILSAHVRTAPQKGEGSKSPLPQGHSLLELDPSQKSQPKPASSSAFADAVQSVSSNMSATVTGKRGSLFLQNQLDQAFPSNAGSVNIGPILYGEGRNDKKKKNVGGQTSSGNSNNLQSLTALLFSCIPFPLVSDSYGNYLFQKLISKFGHENDSSDWTGWNTKAADILRSRMDAGTDLGGKTAQRNSNPSQTMINSLQSAGNYSHPLFSFCVVLSEQELFLKLSQDLHGTRCIQAMIHCIRLHLTVYEKLVKKKPTNSGRDPLHVQETLDSLVWGCGLLASACFSTVAFSAPLILPKWDSNTGKGRRKENQQEVTQFDLVADSFSSPTSTTSDSSPKSSSVFLSFLHVPDRTSVTGKVPLSPPHSVFTPLASLCTSLNASHVIQSILSDFPFDSTHSLILSFVSSPSLFPSLLKDSRNQPNTWKDKVNHDFFLSLACNQHGCCVIQQGITVLVRTFCLGGFGLRDNVKSPHPTFYGPFSDFRKFLNLGKEGDLRRQNSSSQLSQVVNTLSLESRWTESTVAGLYLSLLLDLIIIHFSQLVEDHFGNYVVLHALEIDWPSIRTAQNEWRVWKDSLKGDKRITNDDLALISEISRIERFKEEMFYLLFVYNPTRVAEQKFSSNVLEKVLSKGITKSSIDPGAAKNKQEQKEKRGRKDVSLQITTPIQTINQQVAEIVKSNNTNALDSFLHTLRKTPGFPFIYPAAPETHDQNPTFISVFDSCLLIIARLTNSTSDFVHNSMHTYANYVIQTIFRLCSHNKQVPILNFLSERMIEYSAANGEKMKTQMTGRNVFTLVSGSSH